MTKKKIIGIALMAILVISLISACFRMFREGVYVNGSFYYKVNDSLYRKNALNYITRYGDDTFRINSLSGETTITIHKIEDIKDYVRIQIKYPDSPIIKERLWGGPSAWSFLNYDDTGIIEGIYNIYTNELESVSSVNWQLIIIGIIPYIFGAISFLYPDEIESISGLRRRWYLKFYYNADYGFELSDSGRKVIQFGGVIGMLIGIAIITGLIPPVR